MWLVAPEQGLSNSSMNRNHPEACENRMLGPTPRGSDPVVLGGTQDCAFLTRSRGDAATAGAGTRSENPWAGPLHPGRKGTQLLTEQVHL